MNNSEYTFDIKDIAKVLLKVAQNTRELSDIEKRFDSELEYPIGREPAILRMLEQNGYIGTHLVSIKSDSPSVVIMPFISTEGEGLTPKGENQLTELINNLKKEKKEKKVEAINGAACSTLKWILGIIAAVIAGFIIWKLSWN